MTKTANETLQLTQQLIEKPSVTPDDAGCIPMIMSRLNQIGFQSEIFEWSDVKNLWSKRGNTEPLLVFLGHTDVVPPGSLESWLSPPFEPTIRGDFLYGRGAVDMKGSIAAMVIAVEKFLHKNPLFQGSIAFLLTSDEEGPGIHGTRKMIETLQTRHETIQWCLVGEPSSTNKVGDVIRNGRRGSLSADLLIKGVQGHVAYPNLAQNPIHLFSLPLNELIHTMWDQGNAFFPPTQFQIVHMESGTGTYNVIPQTLSIKFNFRYSPEVTAKDLQQRVEKMLFAHSLNFEIQWQHSAEPFFTPQGVLLESVKSAIFTTMNFEPTLSTGGGTSDGRFMAPLGVEVIELGLCNATIHQTNECVAIGDLENLARIYYNVLEHLFLPNNINITYGSFV